MRHIRWNRLAALLLVSLAASLSLPGCGEEEPPPVNVDEIDFEEAEKAATKEYGGP